MGVDQLVTGGDVDNPVVESVRTEELSYTLYASAYDGADGGSQIQAALDDAKSRAGRVRVVADGPGPDDISAYTQAEQDKGWLLSAGLTIPSNTTLELKDAYLFGDDNVNPDGWIRNENPSTGDSDITLIYNGDAVLNGNYAGNSSTNQSPTNNGHRFWNVDGLKILNATIKWTKEWANNISRCADVTVRDLKVDQVDPNVSVYGSQNGDGIKLHGCKHVLVDGVQGQSQQDLVSVSQYENPGEVTSPADADTYDVTVENVQPSDPGGGTAALIVGYDQSPNIMRNVTFRTIRSQNNLGIIDTNPFGPNPPQKGDITDITLEDAGAVFPSSSGVAVNLQYVTDATISDVNVEANNGGVVAVNAGGQGRNGGGFAADSITLDSVKLHGTSGNAQLYVNSNTAATDEVRMINCTTTAGNHFIQSTNTPHPQVDAINCRIENRPFTVGGAPRTKKAQFRQTRGNFNSENSETATFSGDGTATTFQVSPHGLGPNGTPSTPDPIAVEVSTLSADAIAGGPVSAHPVDTDSNGDFDGVEIVFASAPPSGTDNVKVRWTAKYRGEIGYKY